MVKSHVRELHISRSCELHLTRKLGSNVRNLPEQARDSSMGCHCAVPLPMPSRSRKGSPSLESRCCTLGLELIITNMPVGEHWSDATFSVPARYAAHCSLGRRVLHSFWLLTHKDRSERRRTSRGFSGALAVRSCCQKTCSSRPASFRGLTGLAHPKQPDVPALVLSTLL